MLQIVEMQLVTCCRLILIPPPFSLYFHIYYIDRYIYISIYIYRYVCKKNQRSTSEKAQARTMCLCSNECNSSPVKASHIFLHAQKCEMLANSIGNQWNATCSFWNVNEHHPVPNPTTITTTPKKIHPHTQPKMGKKHIMRNTHTPSFNSKEKTFRK